MARTILVENTFQPRGGGGKQVKFRVVRGTDGFSLDYYIMKVDDFNNENYVQLTPDDDLLIGDINSRMATLLYKDK